MPLEIDKLAKEMAYLMVLNQPLGNIRDYEESLKGIDSCDLLDYIIKAEEVLLRPASPETQALVGTKQALMKKELTSRFKTSKRRSKK